MPVDSIASFLLTVYCREQTVVTAKTKRPSIDSFRVTQSQLELIGHLLSFLLSYSCLAAVDFLVLQLSSLLSCSRRLSCLAVACQEQLLEIVN